jgi:hypothetical protein
VGYIQGKYRKIPGDTRRSGRDTEGPREIHGYPGCEIQRDSLKIQPDSWEIQRASREIY